MSLDLRFSLSTMMFLEFAVWGAWFVVLGQYLNSLNFSRKQIGRIYATMALGAIVAPIFGGSIGDRYLNSETLMVILHLVGAVLLLGMALVRTATKFYWVALAYAMVYTPTLSISYSIMFTHIPDAERDSTWIRVFGTIGWIAANLFLKVLLKPGQPVNNRPLLLAAALSFVLGVQSLMLPETPPPLEGQPITSVESAVPFLSALKLFSDPSFAIFFTVAFLITIALAFYFGFTSLYLEQGVRVRSDNVGPLMTIGQWVEIIFMFSMPWFFDHFTMKTVLVLGMAAWAVRYALFTVGRPFFLVVAGIALHGICFDFFLFAGSIHVAKAASADIVNSAQALYSVLTYGLGMYVGNELSGYVNHLCTREEKDPATGEIVKITNWRLFWLIPCIGALLCLVPFWILFG